MPANKGTTAKTRTRNKTKPTPKRQAAAPEKKNSGRQRGGSERKMTAEAIRQRNQIRAIILFACAIFLGCLVLIPGDNLWKWTHDLLLGLFGGWAILWPLLIIYVAVITTLDRPQPSMTGKVWLTVAIIVLCCATGYLFWGKLPAQGTPFFEFIGKLYAENTGAGGGVVGGLVGLPIYSAAGEVGARIILLLLLFVALMILTGTTLIGLFRTIKKPVTAVSEGLQNARARREEEREILEQARQASIDIPLEPALPEHPVRSDAASLFPQPEPKKKKPEKNEKLEKLKEVFDIVGPAEPELIPEEEPEVPVVPVFPEPIAPPVSTPVDRPVEPEPLLAHVKPEDTTSEPPREDVTQDEPLTEPLPEVEPEQFKYIFPPVTMLAASPSADPAKETEELQTNGRILTETLKSFGVQTKILDICRGPSVTRYEIQPAAGVKISKITNLSDDLALNLAATGVRIEAPIPGKAAVGIEVPNKTRNTVRMRELVESTEFQTSKSKLSAVLGRDIAGQPVVADLAKMPHLLIAGTTGSGKSVCINSLIISMLYKASPEEVRFLMIDPKAVELTEYNGMPHMLVPVVTDAKKAAGALNWAVSEMMKRYNLFAEFNVRNLKGYNSLAENQNYQDENGQPMPPMPQIVIVIDELADLMMAAPKEVEDSICRLAQLARAAGMHLVVATQRPSVDVVTGLIKANIPSRIALTVSNGVDSRTILDSVGAEKLLGNGDMLFAPVGANKPLRVQGCYVSDEEIFSIVEFVKKSKSLEYDEDVIQEIERNAVSDGDKNDAADNDGDGSTDPMLDEAVKVVVEAGQASTSLLQRRLRLGYARAGRLIDDMEQLGIVGPHEGSKPRQVLMTYPQWLERNMQKTDTAVAAELSGTDDE